MLDEVRRFRLHETARLRQKAAELGPSGLDWSRRVLRVKKECRPNADARPRPFNSDAADLDPERGRVAA